jgi:GT2 family glycosyltransferase
MASERRIATASWPVPAPHVVVVVLNWCGEEDTAACLESLYASDYPRLTVLLVDNGSPDGSGARLHRRFPDLPYLQTGENLGYTGGNNRAIEWANAHGADHVVILNNDTEIDAECVSWLVRTAESDPGVGGVAPRILVHDAPDRLWYAGGDLSLVRGTGQHRGEGERDLGPGRSGPEPISFMTGCCFLITRRALDAVGCFEESFFAYNEDTDLSWRLLDAGFRLVYEPRAVLSHKVPVEPSEPTPFQIVQRDRNRRRFVALRLGRAARARFALWFYPTRLVHLARYALRRDWPRARAVWAGMRG